MSERSVHDNNIYAYSVLCEQRRLILYTEFTHGTSKEYTDVVFTGVVAHHFEDVLAGNVLFQVEVVEVERIIKGWSDLFAERKNYGWPDDLDYDGPDALIGMLRQREIKGFEVAGSYGLHGWVLARSKGIRERATKACADETDRE